VQEADAVEAPPHTHGTIHSGIDITQPVVVPAEADLERAAAILNAGGVVLSIRRSTRRARRLYSCQR
jgi:pyruvate dehydrogenase (quinone)